jgi:hypothetical protein
MVLIKTLTQIAKISNEKLNLKIALYGLFGDSLFLMRPLFSENNK